MERQATEMSGEDRDTALFAQLVMQQSNLALMLMGRVPNPQSGEVVQDIDGARLFIDQLEMLESKTRGNLNKEEANLLKQSLMTLRLAFVEAVESPAGSSSAQHQQGSQAQPAQGAQPQKSPESSSAKEEEEHRKKFTKKY